uniref:Protein kinase domain-containing protein n=1 Tax=Sinocyclocheilus grahami TaxID=75366 RepID=A0A672MYX7_SINGR
MKHNVSITDPCVHMGFRYDIKALIGRGSFSRVIRAEHRNTRQPFAIKFLEVKGREGHGACQVELGVLRRVNHSNIILLAEVFETQHRVYLVLELATGGELLERVVAR